ncbi:MAG: aminomethyl-transferring glycine dehydrogenase subunit GcvPA [Fimbriimonadales bacterium]|nr:aminomethyl-transferring glycine dehydrogenase subunit GcvPA [Fimbriimonadales bacterium]
MPYIPHTEADRREMLAAIGVGSIDELFRDIPEELRLREPLDLPPSMDEYHLQRHFFQLASQNRSSANTLWFLGAGLYDRYIPATVPAVISRGEFLTSYTPYQPEFSQGYLQAIYEFQTMVANLYGMDMANASMYDGATALAEAAVMAHGLNGRPKVFVSEAVHPVWRQVVRTYCWAVDVEVVELPHTEGLTADYSAVDDRAACLIVQSPNFFGAIEDLGAARDAARKAGALFLVAADPTAMGLLPPPGEFDADVVVGEGQPLGIPMGFGGPLLGLFAFKRQFVRAFPGRIVGRTVDRNGNPGFTMTLRTREQDIRREKATSNICTNSALMGLCATVYLAALGKNGLRQVAETTVRNTRYAIDRLTTAGARLRFPARVFGEFVLDLGRDAAAVQRRLLDRGIMAGLPLGPFYPGMDGCLLVAVTECRLKDEIDRFADELQEALA